MIINNVRARKILNSSSNYTIEIEVETNNGKFYASVPSGTSKGKDEVQEFAKNSIDFCVQAVNSYMAKSFKNRSFDEFNQLEEIEKSAKRYGGNTVLAFEYAVLKAMADERKLPVYAFMSGYDAKVPNILSNILGGGAHSFGNGPEFQEFLVTSINAENINDKIKINSMVYKEVQKKAKILGRNHENALIAKLSNSEALSVLSESAEKVSDATGTNVRIGIDIAGNNFYSSGKYKVSGKTLSKSQYIDYVTNLIDKYGIYYIEDAFAEDDIKSFSELYASVGKKCLVAGDDLLATDPKKLKNAVKHNYGNAAIVKPNQIGSLIKTKEFVDIAKENKIIPVMSHRSQETEDSILSHLAVALRCPFMKIAIAGGERTAKLNELIRMF